MAPKGIWKLKEEEGDDREIEENAPEEGEIKMPSTKAMATLKNWVHLEPSILV